MKYRHGFVSNSSSSSFIAKGIILDRDKLDKTEIMDKFDFDYKSLLEEYDNDINSIFYEEFLWGPIYNSKVFVKTSSEDGIPDGTIAIGEYLYREDDYGGNYMHDFVIDKDNLCDISTQLEDTISKFGYTKDDIKFFGGTMAT